MMCTLLLAVCSALSKEIGITVVAMCPIYEVLIHRKVRIILLLYHSKIILHADEFEKYLEDYFRHAKEK